LDLLALQGLQENEEPLAPRGPEGSRDFQVHRVIPAPPERMVKPGSKVPGAFQELPVCGGREASRENEGLPGLLAPLGREESRACPGQTGLRVWLANRAKKDTPGPRDYWVCLGLAAPTVCLARRANEGRWV